MHYFDLIGLSELTGASSRDAPDVQCTIRGWDDAAPGGWLDRMQDAGRLILKGECWTFRFGTRWPAGPPKICFASLRCVFFSLAFNTRFVCLLALRKE